MQDFTTLGIRSAMNQLLQENGIVEPTPIQKEAIPPVLAGNDVIAQAQTGTGKTLAFTLPILEKVDASRSYIQALIVTPTRELALQITNDIKKFVGAAGQINVLAVYGGQDVEKQLHKLKNDMHIVIATPGRLLDHVRRGTINLSHVSMLVLDEADQMLHMGFLPDVEQIIQDTSTNRQTMLFSATMPQQIRGIATRYMNKPINISVKSPTITLEGIKQIVVQTSDRAKQDTLRSLLEEYHPYLAIVFCRTKRRAKVLNEALQVAGYDSAELHGDLSQAKREQVMKKFRQAKLQLLVATDVAARGLDVEGVSHVFNYDIPQDSDSYIHRIGRTGRAGDRGLAITLATPKDRMNLDLIQKGIKQNIEKQVSTIAGARPSDEGTDEGAVKKKRTRPSAASSSRKKDAGRTEQRNRPKKGKGSFELSNSAKGSTRKKTDARRSKSKPRTRK